MKSFVEQSLKEIKARVGEEKVICALSGGVDSSCLSILLHRAIGENLIAVFVDNGLLRKNESRKVRETFESSYNLNLKFVEAKERFLKRLKGIIDPEKKRKII